MDNVRKIRIRGYKNELIARMTVTEDTDITQAVRWLAENPDYSFTSIHWQLDANFSGDYRRRRFAEWVHNSYNPGIKTLVTEWVDNMEKEGNVMRWYPFLDPVDDLLCGKKSRLRCGSGYMNYSIMTDGNIAPCPVMAGMSRYYVGHIADADPLGLTTVDVGGECNDCRIRDFCGGRCLYSNITRPWGTEERKLVCETIENLYDALTGVIPRVRDLIGEGVISLSDFAHEKYNGCEIIP
jgi:radical SAM protein with 4Fe4S-binding SPASM domain